jgi:hypothetical protein
MLEVAGEVWKALEACRSLEDSQWRKSSWGADSGSDISGASASLKVSK